MRIIAGSFRGRRLADVGQGDAAAHLRPTTDRIRETLFNVLSGAYGDPVTDARVLDLFAGTGALGLEALSRGAQNVTFVENGRIAQKILTENIALCRAGAGCRVIKHDAQRIAPNKDAPFDLIFLDPPYGKGMGEKAMTAAIQGGWVAPDALIIWEENAQVMAPKGLRFLDARRYGDTTISIFNYEP